MLLLSPTLSSLYRGLFFARSASKVNWIPLVCFRCVRSLSCMYSHPGLVVAFDWVSSWQGILLRLLFPRLCNVSGYKARISYSHLFARFFVTAACNAISTQSSRFDHLSILYNMPPSDLFRINIGRYSPHRHDQFAQCIIHTRAACPLSHYSVYSIGLLSLSTL